VRLDGAVEQFFDDLVGPQPLLSNRSGTLRFDIEDDADTEAVGHIYVAVERGTVAISNKKGRADTVLRLDRALAEKLVTGKANATTAVLRGLLDPEGDLALLIAFQRLFPGPRRGGKGSRGR
jgi:hypothetical protein